METEKNDNQGKKSEANANANYERDTEALKNSSTTSQNSATSSGLTGATGAITREDESGALKSMRGRDTNKPDSEQESRKKQG